MDEQRNPVPVKTVWFACRATEGCTGNQAVLLSSRSNAPVGRIAVGSFEAAQGGSTSRYRCATCNQIFTITT